MHVAEIWVSICQVCIGSIILVSLLFGGKGEEKVKGARLPGWAKIFITFATPPCAIAIVFFYSAAIAMSP